MRITIPTDESFSEGWNHQPDKIYNIYLSWLYIIRCYNYVYKYYREPMLYELFLVDIWCHTGEFYALWS